MRFVTLRWASLATVLSITLATVAMPAVAEAASSTSISMGVTTPLAAGGLETLKHSMGADISACSLVSSVRGSHDRSTALTCVAKAGRHTTLPFAVAGKTPTTPSISNLPATAIVGGSFTATISTTSDGAKSIKSTTTAVCSVTGFKVTYLTSGTCSLIASVAASSHYKAANGAAQSFVIAGKTPTPTNLTTKSIVPDGHGYCALLTSGGVDCWGFEEDGELGNGQSNNSNVPVAVVSTSGSGTLSGVASLTSNGLGYCALLTSGGVDCWGYGEYGELGNGQSSLYSFVPVAVVSTSGSGTLSGVKLH